MPEIGCKTRSNLLGLRSGRTSIDLDVLQTRISYQIYKDDAVFENAVLFENFNGLYG